MRCFSLYRRKTIIFPNLKWMQQDSSNLTPQQWGVKDPKTPAICRGLHSSSRIRTRRHTTHTFNPHFFYCEEKNIFYVTNLNAPIYRPPPPKTPMAPLSLILRGRGASHYVPSFAMRIQSVMCETRSYEVCINL